MGEALGARGTVDLLLPDGERKHMQCFPPYRIKSRITKEAPMEDGSVVKS